MRLLVAGLVLALAPVGTAAAEPLTVRVENVGESRGALLVCLWNTAERFPDCNRGRPFKRVSVPANPGVMIVELGEVPSGRYAVSAMLDTDGDGGPNANALGIPREPVGASGPRPRMGPPRFEAAAFQHPAVAPTVVLPRR